MQNVKIVVDSLSLEFRLNGNTINISYVDNVGEFVSESQLITLEMLARTTIRRFRMSERYIRRDAYALIDVFPSLETLMTRLRSSPGYLG